MAWYSTGAEWGIRPAPKQQEERKMASLFKITDGISELEWVMEQDEIVEGSHEDIAQFLLAPKEEQLAQKIDDYVSFVRHLEARAKAREEEAKHLKDMAKADKNKAKRLKEAAKWASEQLNRPKLEGNTRTITVYTVKTPAVDVVDMEAIPLGFKASVITWKADKDAIKKHLEECGEIVPGVEIRKVVGVRMR